MTSTVATPSDLYQKCSEKWRLPRTLMGGTAAMRAAGKLYLPQEPAESEKAYQIRLDRSTLFNGFRKTVKDMAGKVFAKPVQLGDDVPERLRVYAENIDLTGRHLSNFAYDVFYDGLQTGISYILVEMPPQTPNATRRDDIEMGRRPYLVHVKAENLIGWKSATINGREVLTQARIYELATVDNPEDEFAEKTVERVRVFDRTKNGVLWRLFEFQQTQREQGEWVVIDEGMTSLREITLVPVYVNRTGFMTGEPPLEDLAYVNLAHWQSSSDQRNILHVARVPMWFGKGFNDEEAITIGPNSFLYASSEHADLKIVEHSGAAIGSGREDLKDLEFQMQTLGLELLIPKPGEQTATGRAIDEAAMTAPLAMMADNLKDALERCFQYMAQYDGLGEDAGGSLTVNTDFGISMRDAADINALLASVNAGLISRKTFWKEMVRRGVLMDDFEPEEEVARIEEEGAALGMIGREDEEDEEVAA